MSFKSFRALLFVTGLSVIGLTSACGGDDDDQGTNPPVQTDLSGTYELVSLTQGGITLTPALGATGTLTLTATTYVIDLSHPDPANPTGPPIIVQDNGTYATDGNTWTQESANQGGFQGIGTFTLVGGTLTVDVTTAGVQVVTEWNRTN